MRLLRKKLIT